MTGELIGSALLWPAQQLINGLLQSDRHLLTELSPYTDKTVRIRITQAPLALQVRIHPDGLHLQTVDPRIAGLADATIEGSAVALARLLLEDSGSRPLVNGQLQICGDSQLIGDLFITIKRLDIQWEDLLTPVIGDIGTQHLSQAIHSSSAWARDSHRRMRRNVHDYLKEETSLFPHRLQVQDHLEALDQLRLRLDRLEARILQLRDGLDRSGPGAACSGG